MLAEVELFTRVLRIKQRDEMFCLHSSTLSSSLCINNFFYEVYESWNLWNSAPCWSQMFPWHNNLLASYLLLLFFTGKTTLLRSTAWRKMGKANSTVLLIFSSDSSGFVHFWQGTEHDVSLYCGWIPALKSAWHKVLHLTRLCVCICVPCRHSFCW